VRANARRTRILRISIKIRKRFLIRGGHPLTFAAEELFFARTAVPNLIRQEVLMALLRYSPDFDPVSSLTALQSDLERFLRNPAYGLGVSGSGGFPPVNIFDSDDGLAVIAEVPGVDPQHIMVSGQGHTLTIKGERRRETSTEATGYHRRERSFGEFSRSVQLPEQLDLDKAAASYDAGVLTVRIPKAESAKPRQISVKGA
jgi:HSP20 family protein